MEMIKNVSDYMKIIGKLYPKDKSVQVFFRGQESSNWDVSSAIYRLIKNNNITGTNRRGFARSLFLDFEQKASLYSEVSFLKNHDLTPLDLMFVAQHYGVATRLIDWTINPLVSLYFAVESSEENEFSAVYMIYHTGVHPIFSLSSQEFYQTILIESDMWLELLHDSYKYIDSGEKFYIKDLFHIRSLVNKKYRGNIGKRDSVFSNLFSLHPNCINIYDVINDAIDNKEEKFGVKEYFNIFENIIENIHCHLSDINIYSIERQFGNTKYWGDSVIMIEPLPFNQRIRNQQGYFMFSKTIDDIVYDDHVIGKSNIIINPNFNKFDEFSGRFKILIPEKNKNNIRKELSMYGITRDFIYPELSSYAKSMQQKTIEYYVKNNR